MLLIKRKVALHKKKIQPAQLFVLIVFKKSELLDLPLPPPFQCYPNVRMNKIKEMDLKKGFLFSKYYFMNLNYLFPSHIYYFIILEQAHSLPSLININDIFPGQYFQF